MKKKITFEDIKNTIKKKLDSRVEDNNSTFDSDFSFDNNFDDYNDFSYNYDNDNENTLDFVNNMSDDIMTRFYTLMSKYPEKVREIEKAVGKGEDFRVYFSTKEELQKLASKRYSDPEFFYRIWRKEEAFLNICLKTFGFYEVYIFLDPDKFLGDKN